MTFSKRFLDVAGPGACLVLGLYQTFRLHDFTGLVMSTTQYYYLALACLLPLVFLAKPAGEHRGIRLINGLFAVVTLGSFLYFFATAWTSINNAWAFIPPFESQIVAWAGFLMIAEIARRTGGWPIFLVLIIIGLYPTWSYYAPDLLPGIPLSLNELIPYHMFSEDSLTGIVTRAFVDYVIGFVLFGVVLERTGAGKFFLDLAFALMGKSRGGPAKVAIISSGFMGSLSGSVTSNVMTTGVITIPAMVKAGFPPRLAAAIEACASTGSVFMPPIMGSTAFVMANFLGVAYSEIIIAALIPAVLYYVSLVLQVDAYAARKGLKGTVDETRESVVVILRDGWLYIFAFALLGYLMLGLQIETRAPYIATIAVLILNQFTKGRLKPREFFGIIEGTGAVLIPLAGIIAGISLVVGALMASGMVGTLANDMIMIAGDNGFWLLVMGAATCFVLGIGMTITAAYVFLAVVLAPALIQSGFEPMSVHLFIMYWSMVSFITPPVAIAAFSAASLARVAPMGVGLAAVKFGVVIFFVPFLFVYNTNLIMKGAPLEIIGSVFFAVLALGSVAGVLQGYLPGGGRIPEKGLGVFVRALLVVAAILLSLPVEALDVGRYVLRAAGVFVLLGAGLMCTRNPAQTKETAAAA